MIVIVLIWVNQVITFGWRLDWDNSYFWEQRVFFEEGGNFEKNMSCCVLNLYATPKVTKYQRCNFIIQIHQITIKIDKININLLFECVKIVEFNFNSHVFHVMYQETRFLNQDACFLNQEGRRQFLISFVSEGDWNRAHGLEFKV